MNSPIHLLFTLNDAYLPHLSVVLASLRINDPESSFVIHIICGDAGDANRAAVERQCRLGGYELCFHDVPDGLFDGAPTSRRYPKEMYYRLMAGEILPPDLHKVIYLDPDILVINPLYPLWEEDMDGNMFLAATHLEHREGLTRIDQMRLGTSESYFNTGVIVMDLDAMRREVRRSDIDECLSRSSRRLILPDQDVFNMLYGARTKAVPDELWNYDARKYPYYLTASGGEHDERWVIGHTSILHFCGKAKPWNDAYPYRFGHLYMHYHNISSRQGKY